MPSGNMKNSLRLVTLQARLAVCRFDAAAVLPSWIPNEGFCSVTRTSDELSIVCSQDHVPAAQNVNVERNWACLKVQGPLDFALTGILSSLALPLAQAGIAIFAVSTYDTDYLLVKDDRLTQAVQVLTDAGNTVVNEGEISRQEACPAKETTSVTVTSCPRDAPSERFEPDPFVSALVQSDPSYETFGLVAVAGWPSNRNQLLAPYSAFRTAAELCFDQADVSSHNNTQQPPPVYLYPFSALHVTIATLHSFTTQSPKETHTVLQEQWEKVWKLAQTNSKWPRQSLQLSIDSAQMGRKAGILLWKETTGGMNAMRACIRDATDELSPELQKAGVNVDTLHVPDIVHSTFARYYTSPATAGKTVQERFHQSVLPRLGEFFPDSYSLPHVTLVRERQPYMHVPNDADHVLDRCVLAKGPED